MCSRECCREGYDLDSFTELCTADTTSAPFPLHECAAKKAVCWCSEGPGARMCEENPGYDGGGDYNNEEYYGAGNYNDEDYYGVLEGEDGEFRVTEGEEEGLVVVD